MPMFTQVLLSGGITVVDNIVKVALRRTRGTARRVVAVGCTHCWNWNLSLLGANMVETAMTLAEAGG